MRRLLLSLLLLHAAFPSLQAKKTAIPRHSPKSFRFAAPTFSNLNGDAVAWPGIGNSVVLDAGRNATINDADYDNQNGGLGNYNGATLVVKRSGTTVTSDIFAVTGSIITLDASVGRIKYNGRSFGGFTNANGVLTINFANSEVLPTKQAVNETIRAITYRNDQPAGNATVEFALSDATQTATATVTVNSSSIYVNNITHAVNINPSDGTSLAEAIAVANNQAGTSTIHIVTANNSTVGHSGTSNLNKSAILRFNPNIGINGGAINVAAGAILSIEQGSGSHNIQTSIQGAGLFQNSAAATFLLRGINTVGRMTFSAGTVNINTANRLSSAGLTLNGATLHIALNGTATVDFTQPIQLNGNNTLTVEGDALLSNVVSGSGTWIKSGPGTLTLGANNTFTGTISINAGTVGIASATNLITGNITLGGGKLQLSGTTSLSHPINITSNSSIEVNAGTTTTLTGQINGSGTLTKLGTGNLNLNGTNNNSGGLSLRGGFTTVSGGNNLPRGLITLDNSTLAVSSAASIVNAISLASSGMISPSDNLTLSGVISGNNNLHKIGNGTLTLSGTNSFSSLSFIGTVAVSGQRNLPSGTIAMNSGSILDISSSGTITNDISLVGGNPIIRTQNDVSLTGNVAQLSNGAGFSKSGSGTLTLKGNLSHSGPTNVLEGKLTVDGNLSNTTSLSVASGATLSGSGSIFAIGSGNTLSVNNGGTIAPSGNLIVNGGLSLENGSTFGTSISSNTPNSGYGKTTVSGNVALNSPTLAVSHSYSPNAAHTYTLIEKTSTGAINGTFTGLAQGSTLTATGNGTVLTASYTGGTGNHFTLSTPESTLPVRFVSFKARAENAAIRLDWKTASEKDNNYFSIRRSANGSDFSTIATIPGKGDSQSGHNYTSYDRFPLNGTNYYILLQTDMDGKMTELDTRSINFSLNGNKSLSLAPVPAQQFTIASFPAGTYHIELFDINGRSIQKFQVSNSATAQRINLAGLAQGNYVVKSYGSYGTASAKLIKKD
ncbi:autotransporter-associated beta strand repeat-containing protein [Pedobacter ureilyticus]|uniref:Autotransporter-associated beta strand repeat-containing protein n=1 Tax=Pedobacter ureilyticus TaxID=1393051 RepID=A0ABW9J9U3_9SPHI|nr:autotransporter-associated beta strand repeat-containing protein [Pedobacter helvus]